MTFWKTLLRISIVMIALMAIYNVYLGAQQPGSTVTYQITTNQFNCANQGSQYINCDGIPFNLNGQPAGSMWLYTGQSTQPPYGPYGWGFFFGQNPMAGDEFTITSSSFSVSPVTYHNGGPWTVTAPYQCNGNCSTFTANISGVTPAGAAYTAQAVVEMWYYRACGRWCAYNAVVTGGEVVVRYQ